LMASYMERAAQAQSAWGEATARRHAHACSGVLGQLEIEDAF
jgi:hypothetical protein